MILSSEKACDGTLFWSQPTIFLKTDLSINVAYPYKRNEALNRFFPPLSYIIIRIYLWWRTPGAFAMQKVILDLNSFNPTHTNKLKSLLGTTLFYAGG